MGKKRRTAIACVLLLYLLIGLAAVWMRSAKRILPMADEQAIQEFFDSLEFDSTFIRSKKEAYERRAQEWKAEKEARDALRQRHYDSAVHYWDSVRAYRDSVRASATACVPIRIPCMLP